MDIFVGGNPVGGGGGGEGYSCLEGALQVNRNPTFEMGHSVTSQIINT